MSFDGHFIITTSSKQILTGWLKFFDESQDNSKIILYTRNDNEIKRERKPRKILGFKVNRGLNYSSIFEKPNKKCTAQTRTQEIAEESPKLLQEETKVGELGDAMSRMQNAVMERGEKIQNLDVKIKNMADQAKSWADMIKEQAEKEKNKKWWQL